MEGFSERLTAARKAAKLTQNAVAEHLGVSFQAVSLWERGDASPDIDRLGRLAELLNVTVDYLLCGKLPLKTQAAELGELHDRLFDEERMYTYVKTYAKANGLYQTVAVLPYAREKHMGQFRDGKDKVPYIYHPLLVACQALALGLCDDALVSAALLHDVCEDCGVKLHELPVNEETRELVRLLTKPVPKTKESMDGYYRNIADNGKACVLKLIDRCCNVSGMSAGFTPEKVIHYIKKTREQIYPLFDVVQSRYPRYSNQAFLIKYQTTAVIEALRQQFDKI